MSEDGGFFSAIMMGFVALNKRKCAGGYVCMQITSMQTNCTKIIEKCIVVGQQCIRAGFYCFSLKLFRPVLDFDMH